MRAWIFESTKMSSGNGTVDDPQYHSMRLRCGVETLFWMIQNMSTPWLERKTKKIIQKPPDTNDNLALNSLFFFFFRPHFLQHVLDHPKHTETILLSTVDHPEFFHGVVGWRFAYFTGPWMQLHVHLATGTLSPFLSNEDNCSSCKIYLQMYFGSSTVLVILVFFSRSVVFT